MDKRHRWIRTRRVLVMIIVPSLLAAILLARADRNADRGKRDPSAWKKGVEVVTEETTLEPDASADNDLGLYAGTDLEAGEAEASENTDREPMQAVCFTTERGAGAFAETAGSETGGIYDNETGELQHRSIPVQIDAAFLGGESGEKCWTVYLSSERAAHPRICFTEFEAVTLEPLPEGERLETGRLRAEGTGTGTGAGQEKAGGTDAAGAESGPDAGSEQTDEAENRSRTYRSGEEAEGLTNGSAFRVVMKRADGTEETDDLYVYSCTGMPAMYLDTTSGSMSNVNGDKTKETSEMAWYVVYLPDGSADSSGTCSVSGRGNSTWNMKKRPYNLNLTQAQSVLGMSACKKFCLLANVFDPTNLRDRIAAQMAAEVGLRDTPEGEFVNLYLNGVYNGLYFLSQRPRPGGSVDIKKLDNKILEANGQKAAEEADTALQLPKRISYLSDEEDLKRTAYNWPNEPRNNTGGYLLQVYENYNRDGCWFSTKHKRIRIMSPQYPTVGQTDYIAGYMREAERAIYSEDGVDPQTGKRYESFLDMPSWEKLFLMEEYFVEWDAERWSFYITKERDDPLLYCGPIWDFDHSAGTMLYGDYPETAVSTLMFRDSRHGWMNQLLTHDEFVESLYTRWREEFSPLVHDYLDNRFDGEAAAIESAAYMNNIRRVNDYDHCESVQTLKTWMERRAAFLDDYCGTTEEPGRAGDYCRVEFQFPWGSLSHYVLKGETLGYLPTADYGETQIPSQIRKHEIIGWKDESEQEISAEIRIDSDRVFTPVYVEKEASDTADSQ